MFIQHIRKFWENYSNQDQRSRLIKAEYILTVLLDTTVRTIGKVNAGL